MAETAVVAISLSEYMGTVFLYAIAAVQHRRLVSAHKGGTIHCCTLTLSQKRYTLSLSEVSCLLIF